MAALRPEHQSQHTAMGPPGKAVLTSHSLVLLRLMRLCAARRIVQVCELEVPPPSLEACVVHTAARLLPQYLPSLTGSLRREATVQKALQLTRLVVDVGAAEGRSPWVGAGGCVGEGWVGKDQAGSRVSAAAAGEVRLAANTQRQQVKVNQMAQSVHFGHRTGQVNALHADKSCNIGNFIDVCNIMTCLGLHAFAALQLLLQLPSGPSSWLSTSEMPHQRPMPSRLQGTFNIQLTMWCSTSPRTRSRCLRYCRCCPLLPTRMQMLRCWWQGTQAHC